MQQIPDEWIDKLFACMKDFYGERWTNQFGSFDENFAKAVWKSGLTGLSYEQIKSTLLYYKWVAEYSPQKNPPHQMEFFDIAKNPQKRLYIDTRIVERQCDPEIAKAHLLQIRKKLGLKCST